MNDKDKEAFKEWYINKETIFENCLEAWQAACEYMRSKSNPLDALSLYVKLERERAENKKLRDALIEIKDYGYATCSSDGEQIYNIAEEALEEVGNNELTDTK